MFKNIKIKKIIFYIIIGTSAYILIIIFHF